MPSATKQVACVKRARTCFSKTPSLKVGVPVLVLMNIFVGAFYLQLEQEEVWPVVGSEVCGWRHYWSGGLVRNWSLGFLVRFVICQVMQSLRNGNVCTSTTFGLRDENQVSSKSNINHYFLCLNDQHLVFVAIFSLIFCSLLYLTLGWRFPWLFGGNRRWAVPSWRSHTRDTAVPYQNS